MLNPPLLSLSLPAWIGLLAGAFLLSYFTTALVHRYARERLLDIPNARSSHRVATPRGGGLGIVLSFYAGATLLASLNLLAMRDLLVLASGGLVAAIGFWDDHQDVPALWRMLVHVAAALLALVGLSAGSGEAGSVPWVWLAAAAFWLVWSLNLFNFMDGIDAIAAVEVLYIALAAALLSMLSDHGPSLVAAPLLVLAAATASFLLWNWPPARIFLGDVGSGFVGYVLALLALMDLCQTRGGLGWATWLILNGVFLTDATVTLLWRVASGQRWYEAHRSHAYQIAAARMGSHRAVVQYVAALNLLWLLPLAVAAWSRPHWAVGFVVAAYLPLILLALRLEAGRS